MKKLFILAACALLVAATSCGSDNKEDEIINGGTQGGSTSSESIEARYVDFYETKGASIEEVKRYMSKEAGDLWLTESKDDKSSSASLMYTFHDTQNPPKDDGMRSYGVILYTFLNGGLYGISVELPTYKMCYDGVSKSHESVPYEGEHYYKQEAMFKTKDGKSNIAVIELELKAANTTVGHISCVLR